MFYHLLAKIQLSNGICELKLRGLHLLESTFVEFTLNAGDTTRPALISGTYAKTAQNEYIDLCKDGYGEVANQNQVRNQPRGDDAFKTDADVGYVANQIRRLLCQGKGYGRNDAELYVLKRFAYKFNRRLFLGIKGLPQNQSPYFDENAILAGDDSCERRAELFGTAPVNADVILF